MNDLKVKLEDAQETIGKLMWYRTAYNDFVKINEKYITLFKQLEQDYNHEWPNEDEMTRQHRLSMLVKIKNIID
jgi:hypothetical protein